MDSFKKMAGMKTLLIDDSDVVRDTLTMVYAFKNCFIRAVSNAEDGFDALEQEHFDIIICDFKLPGINGVQFFERVIELYPDSVRVLISGYGNDEIISRATETGIHAFIEKPFSLIAFLERLGPLIDKYCCGELNPNSCGEKKTSFRIKPHPKPTQIAENSSACWR